MNKKSEKRLCWNCEGDISLHLSQCPYCGVDCRFAPKSEEEDPLKEEYGSPFQRAPQQESLPQSPYSNLFSQDVSVSQEEWNNSLDKERSEEEEKTSQLPKRDATALFLLLPGIVLFLFALILVLFSYEGTLILQWDQKLSLFYFLGSIPLLYLGWRAF